jgi:hypothetical protein
VTQILRAGAKIGAVLIAASLPASGDALAEDAPLQGIQQMCLERAGGAWRDDFGYRGTYQRARTNIYSSCMIEHGLRP